MENLNKVVVDLTCGGLSLEVGVVIVANAFK